MNKFVLAGGYVTKSPDQGLSFAQELVKGFDGTVRILDCLFARNKDVWQEVFEYDKEFFSTQLPSREVQLVLADETHFVEQLSNTDVMYFRGGITQKLVDSLKRSGDWTSVLQNKTVAGTSAGVDFLTCYYYDLDNPGIREGLGILPIKVLVHYKSDYNSPNIQWDTAYQELDEWGSPLQILAIHEGNFEVMYR
jgi:peptidase E